MARLTSLLPRDEHIGIGDRAEDLAPQQFRIGRLDLEFIRPDRSFARNWKRVSNVHDASYVLALPLTGSVAFSQDARTGFARPGEYVLLSELAFYELSPDKNARLLAMRIPAAELRGRLVSVEDHVSRRFKPNEQMTRLLVGMIRSVAELFVDSPPPNPQALATEIISFVALTIGSEDRGAATDVRNARYHLRRRIVDFIEKHLSDQSLSPKKIAASSRISLSYLYSLFNDNETTVSQFVQAKRLQRAYEILVADPRGHRTVSEVAYEVGFKNVSHFSRCFSRHFKVAPRDARQTHNASPFRDPRPAPAKGLIAAGVTPPARGNLAPLLAASAASRERLETIPLRHAYPPLRSRASTPERSLNDNQDRLSEHELASFFYDLAETAGRIALTHFRSGIDFERKQDLSPVTIADRAIEQELRRLIAIRFPEHGILGEETGSTPGDRYTWYIDPIDGTKSFISGMPLFGTLIALADEKKGAVIAGMIDMPALAERWYGTPNGTTFNEEPARVSRAVHLEDAQIYTSSPDFFSPEDWARYDALSRKAMFRRFGGDCYQYGLLASGHCDLVVESSLKSFDFMALVPVIEGAGGVICDWEGQPLTRHSDGRVIAAANAALLQQALAILKQ